VTRFIQEDIPLPHTFAFRRLAPCRVEHPSQQVPGYADPDRSCPYFRDCFATSALEMLRRAYGRHIRVTLAEPSSSIVVRSENLFNRDDSHRLTLRKHFYEEERGAKDTRCVLTKGSVDGLVAKLEHSRNRGGTFPPRGFNLDKLRLLLEGLIDETKPHRPSVDWKSPGEFKSAIVSALRGSVPEETLDKLIRILHSFVSSPLNCRPIGRETEFAKYLGFVDLRTHSPLSPVALALLVPPRHLRHDPKVNVVVGNYGYVFGAHGFTSTVYSMHDPQAGGAHCAQACLIMVLGMLCDRGAKIAGSYDLTFFAEASSRASKLLNDKSQELAVE
jgi:hypothetical protein